MPGFSEMEKHFSDFNTPVKRGNRALNSVADGLNSFGYAFVDIGCKIVEPISTLGIEERLEKETNKFNNVCKYAQLTGNRIFVYMSDKYDTRTCFGTLITDGETRWLVNCWDLKYWMMQGIVVVNAVGIVKECNDYNLIKDYKNFNVQHNWVVPPIEFPKNQCSRLKVVYRAMKNCMKAYR